MYGGYVTMCVCVCVCVCDFEGLFITSHTYNCVHQCFLN
jgi:hypothetical protein